MMVLPSSRFGFLKHCDFYIKVDDFDVVQTSGGL